MMKHRSILACIAYALYFLQVKAELPEGVIAGVYKQLYTNGHVDTTDVTCSGKMMWKEDTRNENSADTRRSGGFYKAGDGSGPSDGQDSRNLDSNYLAKDGWYYREWGVGADGTPTSSWEFVKFTSRGTMEVHHFNAAVEYKSKTSPEGSPLYCCKSISNVEMRPACNKSDIVAGTYRQEYTNDHLDLTIISCDGLMSYRDELFRASFSDDGDDNDGNDDASGKQTNGIVTPAGSRKPDARSAQNDNPDYQAVDGWWFRPWSRPDAYEFIKFTKDGALIVHHFTSRGYCCSSMSYVDHRDECCHVDNPTAAKGACVEDELAAFRDRLDTIAALADEEAQAKLAASITAKVNENLADVIASSAGLTHKEVEALIKSTVESRSEDEINTLVRSQVEGMALVSKEALDNLAAKLADLQETVAQAASAQAAVAEAQQSAAYAVASTSPLANPGAAAGGDLCVGGKGICAPSITADGNDMVLSAPGGAVTMSSKQCGEVDLCDVVAKLDAATDALKKLGE